jgi:hypothetical protein
MSAFWIFVLAIPLSIELCGRLLGLRDVWWVRESRPAALYRLVAPVVVLGLMTWWALPANVEVLIAGLLLAPLWQLLTSYALRLAIRLPAFQTKAVSTRTSDPTSTS